MDGRMRDLTLDEFVDVLGSKAPVPGGGGASAATASVGVALGQMVANLTTGKARYADAQPRIDALLPQLQQARDRLLDLADEDARAFEPLARAYRMPHDTAQRQAARDAALQGALAGACETPLAIMESACEALGLVNELARIGSRLAVSDAGAAAAILGASLRAASLNVFVNERSMQDRDQAQCYRSRANALLQKGCSLADDTFGYVERML
ncbi:MAG: cyclodeaminase/cyclohydrolase family protein [Atopobiaceae bacterium]